MSLDRPILGAAEEARLRDLEDRNGRDDQPLLSEIELLELKNLRARRHAAPVPVGEWGGDRPWTAARIEAETLRPGAAVPPVGEARGGEDPLRAFAQSIAALDGDDETSRERRRHARLSSIIENAKHALAASPPPSQDGGA